MWERFQTVSNLQKITKAKVYLRQDLAGTLEKNPHGKYLFQYAEDYRKNYPFPIALSLPLERKYHESATLHPFFDNLIAEGWLLQCAEKILHMDHRDRFSLLMATGQSTIGAVTIRPLDEVGEEIDLQEFYQENLTSEHLKEHFCTPTLPDSPKKLSLEMWGTTKTLKLKLDPDNWTAFSKVLYGGSLSGAQRKGLFYLDKKTTTLIPTPHDAQYILKPQGDFPDLPENEYTTMAIARKLKFPTPPFALLRVESLGHVFTIKRFDRDDEKALMLEDMAQVLEVPDTSKYQSSHEKVAKAIKKFSSAPVIDLTEYFRRIVFCYFIGNGDMHLKNWSLLENPRAPGNYNLSPCYDLLNTRLAIPNEREDIALTLGGKSRNFQRSYFEKFAVSIGLSEKAMARVFSEIDSWREVTQEVVGSSPLAPPARQKYLHIVEERVRNLLN